MWMDIESGVYKVQSGRYLKPMTLNVHKEVVRVKFPYDTNLVAEIKNFQGARWDKPNRQWTVTNNQRNRFRLRCLASGFKGASFPKPFDRYDRTDGWISLERKPRFNRIKQKELMPYSHQYEMAEHFINHRQCIGAGEMGVGKSFALIMAMEWASVNLGFHKFWYVGPKSAVKSVERELIIWNSSVRPEMMTYEELVKRAKSWNTGDVAPEWITFDESSRIKNHSTLRSQAAKQFADGVRDDHGDAGGVILMSGTPGPKSPIDWWHQCDVACPGFLKEGDIYKFRNRMGIVVQKENHVVGGTYPQLVCWRDNEDRCYVCGELEAHSNHDPVGQIFGASTYHPYQKGINEVAKLYRRMKGLVIVQFKKDCLDLPEKQYRIIELKPTAATLRSAALISKASRTTIEALTRLRELSDGFQYFDQESGENTCSLCYGAGKTIEKEEIPDSCPNCRGEPTTEQSVDSAFETARRVVACPFHQPEYQEVTVQCPNCGGSGKTKAYARSTREVPCPKEDALKSLLEEHEESGRIVVFAGFQGSIDRCVRIAHQQGWHVLRVDGRGWQLTDPKSRLVDYADHLTVFQELQDKYPKVCFVGHAKSGGMGLTLTASRSIVYYSNTFDSEDRTQSEDRIHRPGMDENLGATIIDLMHLPTDATVLKNLRAKRKLELMSMGELSEAINTYHERSEFDGEAA